MKSFRAVFRWKHSNSIIAILFGAGLAMVGVGVTIEGSGPLFHLAYFFLIGTFFWSLGCWLTSKSVHENNPQNWNRAKRKRATRLDTYKFYALKYSISAAIMLGLTLSVFLVRWIDERHELSLLRGWLYPASDPLPPTVACTDGLPKNGLLVFFSPKWVGGSDLFPHTVLRVKGKDIVVLDRRPDGALGISLDVFDQNGRIIAKIEKGRFAVNQNNILEMVRTDRSSLRIMDQTGTQVLSIRYFNPQAIWIDAVLYYPGYPYRIVMHGSSLEATICAYNNGTDFVIE